jgi:hypothetical protein
MFPNEKSYMPTDSVNVKEHKKLSAEYMQHEYYQCQLNLRQLKLYAVVIKQVNTFKRILLVINFWLCLRQM